jgi:predicted transcriptional regulator of viral defense system
VRSITGLSAASARNLVHKAQQRGLVTRLKPGLYNLVPFELGWATEHIDSPYLIARELAGAAPYFLSHGTALELHRMVTQPNFTVYVSCTRRVRPQTVGGYDFRFVHIKAEQEFGAMKHWIDKERFVMISDMERTIIDGLRHPAFAGGITEVAKGLWMKRDVLESRTAGGLRTTPRRRRRRAPPRLPAGTLWAGRCSGAGTAAQHADGNLPAP